jgi:hypothetical protein
LVGIMHAMVATGSARDGSVERFIQLPTHLHLKECIMTKKSASLFAAALFTVSINSFAADTGVKSGAADVNQQGRGVPAQIARGSNIHSGTAGIATFGRSSAQAVARSTGNALLSSGDSVSVDAVTRG